MVKIDRVYTKTGDRGETGLVGGSRVSKDCARVKAYGEVDELNAFLGLANTLANESKSQKIAQVLSLIQNELFDLGAELACPEGRLSSNMPKIVDTQVHKLEALIDEFNQGLPELSSFVLPGGTQLNSILHICRTVARRVERSIVSLSKDEHVSPAILIYLNRLSDLLFVLARFESHRTNTKEYLWISLSNK